MQRALNSLRTALGVREGSDPLDEVEEAAAELRSRLDELQRDLRTRPRPLRD